MPVLPGNTKVIPQDSSLYRGRSSFAIPAFLIGGAASAPIVAAHHRETLSPVAVLMALVGYALGNYLGHVTAQLCFLVGGS